MKKRTRYIPNKIIDRSNYYEICLYNYKCQKISKTKIDKNDLEKVKQYKWYLKNGYVLTNKKNNDIYKRLRLHHLIIGKPIFGLEIDHKNGNKLDNRKQNLRIITHQQNIMNRKAKGYYWYKINKKWRAMIQINKKIIHLGYFINRQDAINARKIAENKYFGIYAYNN